MDFAFLTQTILKSLIIIRNNPCTLVYLQIPLGEIKEVKPGMALHRIWEFSTPSGNIFAYAELDNNYNLFTLTHCLTDNKSWITNTFQINCSKSSTLITGPESVTISTHSSPWPALCMAMVCWNPSMLEKVVGVDRALDRNSKVGLQHLPSPKSVSSCKRCEHTTELPATEEQIKQYLRGQAPDEGVLEPVWSVGPIFPPSLI